MTASSGPHVALLLRSPTRAATNFTECFHNSRQNFDEGAKFSKRHDVLVIIPPEKLEHG
jgi:hypothetical protein